jgi:branched-chain amino acid transport system substrate-binding protein
MNRCRYAINMSESRALICLTRPFVNIGLVTILAVAGCSGSVGDNAGSSIELGVVLSLSGEKATYGTDCLNGIKMAVDLANVMGGVKGKQIHLIVKDDSSSTVRTMDAVRELASDKSILGIIGGTSSKLALADASLAQELRTPLILPLATNPGVTDVGSYISRICFIDPYQGSAMAEYSFKFLKLRTVGIISNPDDEYSLGLAAYFTKSYVRLGGQVVFELYQSGPRIDTEEIIAVIREKKPQAVFMPGYHRAAADLVIAVKESRLDVAMLGGDGWESAEFADMTSSLLTEDDRVYITTHFSPDNSESLVYRFVSDYTSRFGERPTAPSALGYDAAGVVCEALRRTPQLSRAALSASLNSTADYIGVTGIISINEKRNPVKDVVVLKAYGGRFYFETTINP